MIELPIYNKTGKQVDTLSIDEQKLGGEVRASLLKQAYVMFHSNRRQGSARTKSRGMVEGSTRKLYKQKGTGNARVGNARTIIRKGGGVAFAKTRTSEDFRRDMPKSMRRLANRNALLAKLVDNEVKCVDSLEFKAPKTKEFQSILDAMGVNRSCLVALDKANHNAQLSARNIADVRTTMVHQLNVFDLLSHRFLVVDLQSLKAFVEGTVWDQADGEKQQEPAAKPRRKTAKEKA